MVVLGKKDVQLGGMSFEMLIMNECSFLESLEGEDQVEVNIQVKSQLRWWQLPCPIVLLPFQSHLSLLHDKLQAVIAQTWLSGTAGKAGRQSRVKDDNDGKPGSQG